MRVNVYSCETSQCDPEVLTKERDGVTYYGLRLHICLCKGNEEDYVTFWATSLANLYVFTTVMNERVRSRFEG
jgi:hypothetical protein